MMSPSRVDRIAECYDNEFVDSSRGFGLDHICYMFIVWLKRVLSRW